jgi:hypothetical protein
MQAARCRMHVQITSDASACMQVMQVDIGAYNDNWRTKNEGAESRISTFADLAMELVSPYGSLRAPERIALSQEEAFWALTGEDPDLLKHGRLLTVRVIWVQDKLAGLVTDNGACTCM